MKGLEAVFRSVFPIKDFSENSLLEYVDYHFEEPKYDVEECQQRSMTYAAPLKVTLRLIVFDVDQETGAKSVKDIKEQDVYMGDIPFMTENGTFVVNGTERVIVSQMHRSPGVFFDHDKGKTHSSRQAAVCRARDSLSRLVARFRVRREGHHPCPHRPPPQAAGDDAALCAGPQPGRHPRIISTRRLPSSTPRTAAGPRRSSRLDENAKATTTGRTPRPAKCWPKPAEDHPAHAAQVAGRWRQRDRLADEELVGRYSALDMVNVETGEIYVEAGDELTDDNYRAAARGGLPRDRRPSTSMTSLSAPIVRNTMAVDKNHSREQALIDIYRVMRPGEPPTRETAETLFGQLFFDRERYDLSSVGRVKMNMRLNLDAPDTMRTLRKEDILAILKALADLRDGRGEIDDIDNLGNRRVRSVGELMENQFRIGLLRMERAIKERMSSVDIDTRDAARPDQCEARGGGGARVLRLLAAVAIHGSDQSAVGSDSQAPHVGLGRAV